MKNIDNRRLLRYNNDEKLYKFDRKLRLLNLEFLEILELDFKKNFLKFLEGNNLNYFDRNIYLDKFLERTIQFIEIKNNYLVKNDKEVRFYFRNNNIISNYLFIEKLTFGEIFKLFRNLKLQNKKIIAKKYRLNVFMFESWIYASKYIRNICSHYFNLFNFHGIIRIESRELLSKIGSGNSYLVYFLVLSIFEKNITGKNKWQNKVIDLINNFDINIYDLNLKQKNNLPSKLETEAWKVLVNSLYNFYIKKSNKNNIKYFKNLFIKNKFNIILAVDGKNGLGKNNDLAWRISADLKYFKKITTSGNKNVVIMGRKTWDSIPEKYKPLPDRINCIISRDISKYKNSENIKYFDDFNKCLSDFSKDDNIFLIGGAALYNKFINHKNLDKVFITRVKGDFNCDVFFKGISEEFILESKSEIFKENGIEFSFEVYKKK